MAELRVGDRVKTGRETKRISLKQFYMSVLYDGIIKKKATKSTIFKIPKMFDQKLFLNPNNH